MARRRREEMSGITYLGLISLMSLDTDFVLRVKKLRPKKNNGGSGLLLRTGRQCLKW